MNEISIVQGLKLNTLVAGKTTAIRLYTDPWPITPTDVNAIVATITRPDGVTFTKQWQRKDFVIIPKTSKGQSIVVSVEGKLMPLVGPYNFQVQLINPIGGIATTYTVAKINFLPTRDIRFVVSRLWSGTNEKPNEIAAIAPAMTRMAALLPVRDGVSTLNGDRNAGLRYSIDNNPSGPPNQDGHICPVLANLENRPPSLDSIDRAITYRFPDVGEGSGGNANHFCAGQSVPYCVIVWGAPLLTVFLQETAHSFGLEAASSPHLDPNFNAAHSKDALIDATDSELGFDIQFNQSFPVPTKDVMYPTADDPELPDPNHSLNSFDWEFIRQQILKLPNFLMQTNVAPSAVGIGNSMYFFAKNIDGRIFQNHAVLGQGAVGWTEMEGNGLTNLSPSGGAIGSYAFVVMRGLDGNVYLNQADKGAGRAFGNWQSMNFKTDVAPCAAGVGNSMYFFAKHTDGRIFQNHAVLGQAGVGWTEMEGGGRTDLAPSAGAIGSYVFVVVKGLDGNVYLNQADKGAGRGFGNWQSMNFKTDVAPCAVGIGNSMYFFAKHIDGRIFQNHAVLGQAAVGWTEVEGGGKTNASPSCGAIGSYAFVTIEGLDGNIYLNQADKGAGRAFGYWQHI
jgi:hypothetical protein